MTGIFVRHKIDTLTNDGGLSIGFDGRIDNRQELCAATGLPGDSSDDLVTLAAYELWTDKCLPKLLGDFAFVIRDDRRGRILCARDPVGIRPLYYYCDGKILIAASELRHVLTGIDGDCSINEGMVAEYLACSLSNNEETLWKSIYRLPPGHSLTVAAGRMPVARRYFDMNFGNIIRCADDREYASQFLHLLRDAVRCRVDDPKKTGILLSGGVDSSTVAATAASLGAAQAGTFSLVFPGLPCDETTYIQQVNEKLHFHGQCFAPKQYPILFYANQASHYSDFPDYPNGAMCHGLRELASANGVDVLLTGLGGDEWLMGSYYHYADLIKRLRFTELWSEVRGRADAAGRAPSIRPVIRFGVLPLIPGLMRRPLEQQIRGKLVPNWICPVFAARTCLEDRLRTPNHRLRFASHAQEDIWSVLTSPWRLHALELEDRASRASGIEQRHPLSDRRIIEFALALPEQQRWRCKQTKFVQREAMRGLLPEVVRLRRSKAEFSPVFMNTFQAGGGVRLFEKRDLAAGWINNSVVVQKYNEMQRLYHDRNPQYTRHSCPLWMILGIDLWRQGYITSSCASKQRNSCSMKLPRLSA